MSKEQVSKKPSSRELVRIVATRLLEAGEQPTHSLIRDTILAENNTSVSPNLVVDELRAFWMDMGKKLVLKLSKPGIPTAVIEAFDGIWEAAVNEAQNTLATEKAASQKAVVEAEERAKEAENKSAILQHQLELAMQELGHVRDQLAVSQQRLADLEHSNTDLSREARELSAANGGLRRDIAAQEERHAAEAQRLIQSHSDEMERTQALHADEIQRLSKQHNGDMDALRTEMARQAEAWDGARRHLMMETDRMRDSAKNETERMRRELDEYRQMDGQLRIQRSNALEQVASLNGRLEQTERELRRTQENMLKLAKEHATEVARIQAQASNQAAGNGPANT